MAAGFVGMQEYVAIWEDMINLNPASESIDHASTVIDAFGAIYNLSFGDSVPSTRYHSMVQKYWVC